MAAVRGALPSEGTKPRRRLPASSFPFLEVKGKPQNGIHSSLLQKAGELCSGFFFFSALTPFVMNNQDPLPGHPPASPGATLGPEWFAVDF